MLSPVRPPSVDEIKKRIVCANTSYLNALDGGDFDSADVAYALRDELLSILFRVVFREPQQ